MRLGIPRHGFSGVGFFALQMAGVVFTLECQNTEGPNYTIAYNKDDGRVMALCPEQAG